MQNVTSFLLGDPISYKGDEISPPSCLSNVGQTDRRQTDAATETEGCPHRHTGKVPAHQPLHGKLMIEDLGHILAPLKHFSVGRTVVSPLENLEEPDRVNFKHPNSRTYP